MAGPLTHRKIVITTAERLQAKIRIGLFGPSGSGKTVGALKIGHGLEPDWSKIFLIDTENKSGLLYASDQRLEIGAYKHINIEPPYEPEIYVDAIKAAEADGATVIVLDSISHEWMGTGGMLEIADQMSAHMKDGRQVWTKITPRHNRFIDAILQSPCHVICCGRVKQDVILNMNSKGGKDVMTPEKVGLKAVTRDGFDFEMTVSFDIAINNFATCSKDRTGLFKGKPEKVLNEKVGELINEWNKNVRADSVDQKREIAQHFQRLGYDTTTWPAAAKLAAILALTGHAMADENLTGIVAALAALTPEAAQAKYSYAPPPPPEKPPTPPAPPAPAAEAKPPQVDANSAETAAMVDAGLAAMDGKPPAAATEPKPESPAPRARGTVLTDYSARIGRAKTPAELDEVHGLIVLDKDAHDPTVAGILEKLEDRKMMELMGVNAPEAPGGDSSAAKPDVASGTENAGGGAAKVEISSEGAQPACATCNDTRETITGADCPSCQHHVVKQEVPAAAPKKRAKAKA